MDEDVKAQLDAMQQRTERLLNAIRQESWAQHAALLQRLGHLAVRRACTPHPLTPTAAITADQLHTLEQLVAGTLWATIFALLWHTGIRVRELLDVGAVTPANVVAA